MIISMSTDSIDHHWDGVFMVYKDEDKVKDNLDGKNDKLDKRVGGLIDSKDKD